MVGEIVVTIGVIIGTFVLFAFCTVISAVMGVIVSLVSDRADHWMGDSFWKCAGVGMLVILAMAYLTLIIKAAWYVEVI
jgi:hypothetical protein